MAKGHRKINMFSIRNNKDNNIVTKSVVPTSTTARQLATVLLENITLKEALRVAKDFNPSDGGIPNSKPVGLKDIGQVIKDTENRQGAYPQKVVEKNADVQRIERVASKMVELDAKAIESQKAYRSESGWTLRSAGKVILPTGCPTERIQATIGEVNTRRMDEGKTPFLTYNAYNNPPTSITEGDYTWVNAADLKAAKVSKSVPQYIVPQKYYLLRDNGTTFIYNNATSDVASGAQVYRLMKQVGQSPASDNSHLVILKDTYNPPVNLTEADHQDIIKACPPYEDLLNVYVLCPNVDELEMDFGKAAKLFQC